MHWPGPSRALTGLAAGQRARPRFDRPWRQLLLGPLRALAEVWQPLAELLPARCGSWLRFDSNWRWPLQGPLRALGEV